MGYSCLRMEKSCISKLTDQLAYGVFLYHKLGGVKIFFNRNSGGGGGV